MKNARSILLSASGGGHMEQLGILLPAFDKHDLVIVTPSENQARSHGLGNIYVVTDCNKSNPLKVIKCLYQTYTIVRSLRPVAVVSTGAAPGLMCLFWGRIFKFKTIWIDSVANAECLSLSGKIACYFCDVIITQWEHLANDKVKYIGRVL